MTERARAGERTWTPWLVLALGLHAVTWLVFRPEQQRAPTPPDVVEASISVELEADEAGSSAAASEPELSAPSVAVAGRATRASRGGRSEQPEAAAPVSEADETGREQSAAPAGGPPTTRVEETLQPPAGPRLSLQNLGVGGENPFLSRRAPRRASAREVGETRFKRALAADIARADQAVGLGPEGPALTQIEAATRTGNPAPNSNALFEFTTDSKGKLLSVELLESSSDPTPWRRIARAARAALASTLLRVPKAGYGVTFRVRVTSHVELPSGADPGLAVNIAGIPLKRGEGPRSASIDILNIKPELSEEEVSLPSGQTAHVPTLKLGSLLGVTGDLADIGSPARRMVRAHLESLSVADARPSDTL